MNNSDLNLLPNKAKYFGYLILIILLTMMIFHFFFKIFDSKTIFSIVEILFLLSLMIISISKDKIEDELTIKLRLRSFTASLFSAVGLVITNEFLTLFGEGFKITSSFLLIQMFCMYFIIFFILKTNR